MKKVLSFLIVMSLFTINVLASSTIDGAGHVEWYNVGNIGFWFLFSCSAIIILSLFVYISKLKKELKKIMVKKLKPPILRQCELKGGKLKWKNNTGSGDDEIFYCFKRIFQKGMYNCPTHISVQNEKIPVFLITDRNFSDFLSQEYCSLLEKIIREEIMCGEDINSTNLYKAIYYNRSSEKLNFSPTSTNVWVDIENDIVLAVTIKDMQDLIVVLEHMKFTIAQSIYRT